MYSIIQKICEKNNKILKEGVKKVLNGDDVSSLTGAIKDFTDVLGKKLFGVTGVKIPIGRARDELYYELKNIWYGNAV